MAVNGRQMLESSVLSAMLGFGPLGIINRAVGLSQMFCGKPAAQLLYSIYPLLPRLETTTGQAGIAGNLILRLVSWAIIPLAVCLSILAVPVIHTVYGQQWLAAAPILGWTLAWVVSSALVQVAYSLSLARQLTRLCLVADIINLASTALCLWLLLPLGVTTYFAGLIVAYQVSLWMLI